MDDLVVMRIRLAREHAARRVAVQPVAATERSATGDVQRSATAYSRHRRWEAAHRDQVRAANSARQRRLRAAKESGNA